ncbi:sulfatase-like hydrolase/transferase [Zobellia uliginosa]|uniref:sulfatase-like hydrolase/transferase n=1 Tax=Zobellia uliginosa TaxID=143224 RepID=UPI0026E16980|nr:sulfatase-like hydrolase/transferase [Zobellia uliginosa]MDO6519890.1 sulfatase-like hydrolase/transferase [Zobellia uliginosa]
MYRSISYYLPLLALLLLGACKPTGAEKNNKEDNKPNFVFLFADDQTFESIRALGFDEVHTPNLDRLVNGGTSFSHAYNMGGWNGAICVASRAMIISGSYIWNAQKKSAAWAKGDSTALSQTWGKLLEKQGYDTYMTGKWHVRAPAATVFKEAQHIRPGMPGDKGGQLGAAIKKWKKESGDMKDWNDYMPLGYGRPTGPDDTEWSPTDTLQGGFWEGGKHWSEVVRDDALSFIEKARKKDDPFFMYLAFNATHDPRQAPQRFLDMYPVEDIKVPDNFMPEYPWKDDMGNPPSLRDEALAPYPRTEYAVKVHRQEYYALLTHMDEQIGKILDALEASGKMENTYIFFGADHGLSVGHHGLIGKQSMFDHSVRIPMMVVGPGIPKGKLLGQDVYLQDIMATTLDLAHVDKPEAVQFHSFMDIIKGERQESHYDGIYGAYIDVQRMIRKDGFKLIVYPKIGKVLLFDLKNDPNEMNDLANDKNYAKKVETLFADLMELQQTMGDELSLTEIYAKVQKGA